jgi:hypothetical protein
VDLTPRSAKGGSRVGALLVLAAVLIFVVLVVVGASGVRGSDQYWYVADVESLIDGRGVQTNEIYPVTIRHEVAPLPRPFVHNILNVYVAALPALLFGAYGGWIVVNVFCSLLTAFLIFRTVARLADSHAALAAAVGYLLLPVTIWLTMQPLAEASISPLVALAAYVYVTANSSYWRWMLLIVIGALLVCCRPTFVLLLPLIPLAYVAHVTPWQIGTVARAAGIAALGFALWILGKHLLEPNVSVSYLQVIGSDGPNFSNMTNFFDLSPQPPTISAIVANVVKGLAIQFTKIDAGYALFYLPFNVLALAPLVLLRGSRRTEVIRVAMGGLVAVGLHLITALLVRNQFRYLLVATPPLLMAAGIVLARAEWLRTIRTSAALMTAAVLTLAAPSATLAWRSHNEGIEARRVRANLADAFSETLPTDETVMVALNLKGFEVQMLGYVLRPRPVLYVYDRYDTDDYAALIKNGNVKWLMSRRDAPMLDRLTPSSPRHVRTLPAPFADWSLFTIETGARPP